MQKVKVKVIKDRMTVPFTVNLSKELYERLCDSSYQNKIAKKVFVSVGLEKLLDDIEQYGLDVE